MLKRYSVWCSSGHGLAIYTSQADSLASSSNFGTCRQFCLIQNFLHVSHLVLIYFKSIAKQHIWPSSHIERRMRCCHVPSWQPPNADEAWRPRGIHAGQLCTLPRIHQYCFTSDPAMECVQKSKWSQIFRPCAAQHLALDGELSRPWPPDLRQLQLRRAASLCACFKYSCPAFASHVILFHQVSQVPAFARRPLTLSCGRSPSHVLSLATSRYSITTGANASVTMK
jgi:hypothetical protein